MREEMEVIMGWQPLFCSWRKHFQFNHTNLNSRQTTKNEKVQHVFLYEADTEVMVEFMWEH